MIQKSPCASERHCCMNKMSSLFYSDSPHQLQPIHIFVMLSPSAFKSVFSRRAQSCNRKATPEINQILKYRKLLECKYELSELGYTYYTSFCFLKIMPHIFDAVNSCICHAMFHFIQNSATALNKQHTPVSEGRFLSCGWFCKGTAFCFRNVYLAYSELNYGIN